MVKINYPELLDLAAVVERAKEALRSVCPGMDKVRSAARQYLRGE